MSLFFVSAIVLTGGWFCRPANGKQSPAPPKKGAKDYAQPSDAEKEAALKADDRGLAHYRKGQYPEAARDFTAACRKDGTNATVQTHLGLLLEKQMKYAESEKIFRELAERVPRAASPRYWLGKALYHLKRYDEANKELNFAIQLSPDKWAYHYYLAASLREQGKAGEANKEHEQADRMRRAHPVETP